MAIILEIERHRDVCEPSGLKRQLAIGSTSPRIRSHPFRVSAFVVQSSSLVAFFRLKTGWRTDSRVR